MVSPIRRIAISATARLKRKKLVDVLIEMFLKSQSESRCLIITKNNQMTQKANVAKCDKYIQIYLSHFFYSDYLTITWQTRMFPQVPVAPITM